MQTQNFVNERLLESQFGSIYQTKEYANFVEFKNWESIFIKFLDNKGAIKGQILISKYRRFSQSNVKTNLLSKIPGTKKMIYRWVFGPIIFDKSYESEINKKLSEFLISKKCKVFGSEHPLSKDHFTCFSSKFVLEDWGTFLIDLQKETSELWEKFDKHSARKNIERSKKRNVTVNEITEKDLINYHSMLEETKNKVDWNVNLDEILFLLKTLNPIGFSGFIAKVDDIPVGGILFSFFNRYINEWGVARTEKDFSEKLYSQDLFKWNIINWGIKNNCLYYDLTGANPNSKSTKEAGIFRYKKKWGGDFVKYKSCKL